MFNSVLIHKLRHSEFIQYIDYLLEIIETKNPEHLKVKEIQERLREKYDLMASIFKPDQGSEITPQLQEADERRDDAINGIATCINAFAYHFHKEKNLAAKELLNDLDKYGAGIARLNYQSETSTIESIVSSWKNSEKLTNALSTLDITDWVEEMDQANQLFKNYYFERLNENAESPDIRMKELRGDIIDLYRLLLNQLEVHATINNDEVYDATVRSINELNDEYNHLILIRQDSGEEDEEDIETEAGTQTQNN